MTNPSLTELSERYDTGSTAAEMDGGRWETDTDADAMITTSLRLPKSLLDWVRQQAEAAHVRPTTLIRQWIEQRRDTQNDELTARVDRLEQAAFFQQK